MDNVSEFRPKPRLPRINMLPGKRPDQVITGQELLVQALDERAERSQGHRTQAGDQYARRLPIDLNGFVYPHLHRRDTHPVITCIGDLDEATPSETYFEGMVGRSSALRGVLRLIETVAASDLSVLLLGETGTGKELIARAIHNRSLRRERSLVKLNCAAIPSGLLESELFGHEGGAFTGAIAQKVGRFELADQGSLFLDEIGDIPLELQSKLLRVLQEQEFERLGTTRTKKVDVRILAATHRELEGMILEKQFRRDLYYRLNVFPICIPPLRQRPNDIPLLVRHFVDHAANRMNKAIDSVPAETMAALTRYPWPGNIRELKNVMERAVILSSGPVLEVSLRDLRTRIAPWDDAGRCQTLEEVERKHILATLKETKWVLSGPRGAATRLGIKRSTLQFRMRKLGIVRPNAI